jgi:hypothetical protein
MEGTHIATRFELILVPRWSRCDFLKRKADSRIPLLYAAQKEELEGARNKASPPRGSLGGDTLADMRLGSPYSEKLISWDSVEALQDRLVAANRVVIRSCDGTAFGRNMRLSKANIAGLPSPQQQAEMKSILAGAWPPLKPLPVFKYETVDYRATIDFDRRRGEWVCRKTSLPSNKVQELRGGLREITMELPHGEAEIFTEDPEQQEQESEKDTNRRLQAIHEWRENYKSGALYFELRDYLSESQRTEIGDSLRLSLTARQLQFSAKNVGHVFDALSTAGGRFATLIEFAKRSKAKQGTAPKAQGKEAVLKAERAMDQDSQSLGSSSHEFGSVPNSWLVGDEDAVDRCSDEDEFPTVSITNVLPERDQASWTERIALDTASQQSEIETSEIVETNSSSVIEHAYQEEHYSPALIGSVGQVRTSQSPADGIEDAPARSPALEISAFQVAIFGILFLFAVLAFTVGLTVGRGPLGSRFREVPKSMLAGDTKPPAQPDQAGESTSPAPTPVTNSNDSAGTHSLGDAKSAEEKSKDPDSVPTTESKASAKPEVFSDRSGAMKPNCAEKSRLTVANP